MTASVSAPPCCRSDLAPESAGLSGAMTVALATAVGIIFLNVPAPQTLVGVIGPAIGLSPSLYGLVATAPLIGYAIGLLLLTPLADLLENRALITRTLAVAAVVAVAPVFVRSAVPLLMALFLLGVASAAVQMVVPLAAALAAPAHRGRVVGDIMSGIMIGVLLARPIASLVEHAFGWRAFYGGMAVALAAVAFGLAVILPRHRPQATGTYISLIGSLLSLLRAEPVLRRRALLAALGFAAFNAFWTSVALELAGPRFQLDQTHIALFALAGAGAAIIAPLAGRAGDRGWTRAGTVLAHLVAIAAFAMAAIGDRVGADHRWAGVVLLALSAIVLDVGVIGDQTLGRRAINLLNPDARARLNGLFVGLFFVGGSIGSASAGVTWTMAGWTGVCVLGASFVGLASLSDVAMKD